MTQERSLWQKDSTIIVAVLLTMVLSWLPIVHYVLLPFEFFTTLIHEMGHTLASLAVGEEVGYIVLNPDTSGYMTHTVSTGMFAQMFISSSGYLGAAIFGGLLLVLGAFKNASKKVLFVLGILLIVITVIYVRGWFGFVVAGVLSVGILLVGWKAKQQAAGFFLDFLAVQCSLNAITALISLVYLSLGAQRSEYSLGHSDADALTAHIPFIPSVVWSVLWVIIAVVLLIFFLRKRNRLSSRHATA